MQWCIHWFENPVWIPQPSQDLGPLLSPWEGCLQSINPFSAGTQHSWCTPIGFKFLHSRESTHLRVSSDALLFTDSGDCMVLFVLDLAAAFKTPFHESLLCQLMQCVGIRGRLECYADDTLICMPYKKKDSRSIKLILECLEDIKTWMACNFLNWRKIRRKWWLLVAPPRSYM